MSPTAIDAVLSQALAVLQEGFQGPAQDWSYFTDSGSGAGFMGTASNLEAGEASRPIGGTSIAAHVHHTIFGLRVATAWINGDRTPKNWSESWSVKTVDDAAWKEMRQDMENEYRNLRKTIESKAAESSETMGAAIGAIAHAAYHLGAVRQKIAVIKNQ